MKLNHQVLDNLEVKNLYLIKLDAEIYSLLKRSSPINKINKKVDQNLQLFEKEKIFRKYKSLEIIVE